MQTAPFWDHSYLVQVPTENHHSVPAQPLQQRLRFLQCSWSAPRVPCDPRVQPTVPGSAVVHSWVITAITVHARSKRIAIRAGHWLVVIFRWLLPWPSGRFPQNPRSAVYHGWRGNCMKLLRCISQHIRTNRTALMGPNSIYWVCDKETQRHPETTRECP